MKPRRSVSQYLRSSKETPTRLLAALAFTVAQDVAVARRLRFIPLDDRVRWTMEKPEHANATWRLLYAVLDLADIDPDAVSEYGASLRSVARDRRRPLPDLTQGGDRMSPPLF
jgi:hypothetical protein